MESRSSEAFCFVYTFDTFGAADHSARLMNPRSFFLMKASFRRKKLAYSADERRRRRAVRRLYFFIGSFAFCFSQAERCGKQCSYPFGLRKRRINFGAVSAPHCGYAVPNTPYLPRTRLVKR